MSEERRAVIDRFINGQHAVLIIGDSEEQRVVDRSRLPTGAREGTWLRLQFDDDELIKATIDTAETERVRARVEEKMRRLRERGRN